jgi:peptidoglycan/LPS O-acetylase OafA/YrhL
MNSSVRGRSRTLRILGYVGALAFVAALMETQIWWLDAACLGVVFAVLLVFSARTLYVKRRSSDARDLTAGGQHTPADHGR